MNYNTLGKTGLRVSVAGLGCGGHSRLGQGYGRSERDSVAVIGAALDLGINFIDTARAYGTEAIVGKALRGKRDNVILSTKSHIAENPFSPDKYRLLSAEELTGRVEDALKTLQTDYIDIFHLHGLMSAEYDHAIHYVVPVLEKLREAGKIRFLALSERFIEDPAHIMLGRAVHDGIWDVFMVGFNILNPSARQRVLEPAIKNDIGILDMFAARRALTSAENLTEELRGAIHAGKLPAGFPLEDNPLAFLVEEGYAGSLIEAAYRFVRHEPGIHVVLTGTGNSDHLCENANSINMPPLPAPVLDRLHELFGDCDTLTGD